MTRREVLNSFFNHWDKDSKCQPEYFDDSDLGFIKRSVNELVGDSSDYRINNPRLSSGGDSLSFDLTVDGKKVNSPSLILKSYYKDPE